MRLAATIEVEGSIYALGPGADPPRDGVSFRNVGGDPKTLYVNGMEVGELVRWPDLDFEHVWVAGQAHPDSIVVKGTTIACWLELPHVGDVP